MILQTTIEEMQASRVNIFESPDYFDESVPLRRLAAMHGEPIPQFPPALNVEWLLTK